MSDLEVRVRNIALRCSRLSSISVIDRLQKLTALLSELFGVQLVLPLLADDRQIKEFLSGLLEKRMHPWTEPLRRLSSRHRYSVAFSLFLFRKLLPSPKPEVSDYVRKMCSHQEPPDDVFLDFVRRTVRRMFPVGWDKSYEGRALTSTLPLSACAEQGRKGGGCRGLDASKRMDRGWFCQYVLASSVPHQRRVSKVTAVETGGKWRIVSCPPRVDNALRPLHTALYDRISRFPWLLRGDAKPSSFSSFQRLEGEVFVSGDYESATDNLNTEVQRTILVELLMKCRSVPRGVALHALSTLETELAGGGESGFQKRGQLMGNLLSFPLLCLVNYITFKFCVPRDVPVRINGDDIVFRCTREESQKWFECVGKSGLIISPGKTMVHRRFFSLNSTLFDASVKSNPLLVPFVRSRAVWSSKERWSERICSLKSRFYSSGVGFWGWRKKLVRAFFLSENRSTLYQSCRSATRGMGIDVGREELQGLGLWHRELYYLEQIVERPLPGVSFSEIRCNDIPDGFSRKSAHWFSPERIKEDAILFRDRMVANAWEKDVLTDEEAEEKWRREALWGCSPWSLSEFLSPRARKLLRLTRAQAWRWFNLRCNEGVFGRVSFSRDRGVWISDGERGSLPDDRVEDSESKGSEEERKLYGWCCEEDDNPVPSYSLYQGLGPPSSLLVGVTFPVLPPYELVY